MLEITGLSKRFGGLQAVRDVTLSVPAGQVRGVIGPNGAGKSTLFNLVTGHTAPDTGRVMLGGAEITGHPMHQIARAGVARVFQRPHLFAGLTALENVMVGMHRRTRGELGAALLRPRSARAEEQMMRTEAAAALQQVGMLDLAGRRADQLTYGHQRFVEVARAVAGRPKLLLLDEPFTGMTNVESGRMLDLVRELNRGGLTVVIIDHNMSLMFDLCQRVTVLHYGQVIADDVPEAVRNDAEVIDAYLGGGRQERAQV